MWKTIVYQGNDVILEHSQNDFMKVLRFAVNAVVELINNNAQDYRVIMHDKQGYVYFSAFGMRTDIKGMQKVG